jgi:hypothetical protein
MLLTLLLSSLLSAAHLHFTLYKLPGKEPGPTLLVFGGIHGNEPGGYFAPAILATHYTIEKGNLWVTPNLNFDSIIRNRRGIYGDMNRKFATISKKDPDRAIVEEIKALIQDKQVDLILNLHDGHGYYRKSWENSIFNPKAWGQACIIDQKCIDAKRFGNLDQLSQHVSERLNRNLIKNHHIFNIKNTHTKLKDEQMRLSLTYFAITHGKPALAIETSKNITDIPQKVFYQLRAIEAFMDEMGIAYHRDFDMNIPSIKKILSHHGNIVINDNFLVPLDGIDRLLRFVPLKRSGNAITSADSPLAALKQHGNYYDVMIGNQKITTLQPDYFQMGAPIQNVNLVIDGKKKTIHPPARFQFHRSFRIEAPKAYRVNVIGFSRPGHRNENGLNVTAKALDPRYAMDKENRKFRVEFYKNGTYCGMVIAEKAAR